MVCMGSSAQSAALGLAAAPSIDGLLFLAAVAVLGDTVGFPFARRERFVYFSRISVRRRDGVRLADCRRRDLLLAVLALVAVGDESLDLPCDRTGDLVRREIPVLVCRAYRDDHQRAGIRFRVGSNCHPTLVKVYLPER